MENMEFEKDFKTAVILAGGKSSRMGFNKEFLSFNGKNILDNTIFILKKVFEEIIVITENPQVYKNKEVLACRDLIPGLGPVGGIYTALKIAKSHFVYFIACDMPYINIDFINYMKISVMERDVDVCVTQVGEYFEPFNSFYSKNLTKMIEENIAEKKLAIYHLVKNSPCLYISQLEAESFSPNLDMFANLNTPDDVNKVLRA